MSVMDDRDKLTQTIDQLISQSDTRVIHSILHYEDRHQRYMLQNYRRFMNQFEMYYSMIVKLGDAANYYDRDWPVHRSLQFLIFTHSNKQFYSAYKLLINGFYVDSIAMLRGVYETFLRIIFITLNHQNPYNIYHGLNAKGPKFNATNLITQDLQLEWIEYSVMSAFVHSNQIDVMEDYIAQGKDEKPQAITLRYRVDEERIGLATNYCLFLLLAYMKLITELFVGDYQKLDSQELNSDIDLASTYSDVLMNILKSHTSSDYWRVVANDMDDIFQLIHSYEDDLTQDWKSLWENIRDK